ncbi:SMI1/KNR4 family protein [Streptomyces sp. C10-9-1]|uniref:SMI1/KNR4 family protein n=1 Tax=Streptomyces sp. C10-9-1 TaxID=1859285 RepID=UPI0021135C99|nr:SMI1/KNR4 family protein [Streptomyces sp. C10-9-1]MCQ6555983.1 SMI1/KNR4 family protein [Streptomyces sp. C10-9-1]
MSTDEDLLARVADRARAGETPLPPAVSAADVAASEAALGFALPPLLAALYREVANGGFGPEYTLLPLVGPTRTVVSAYHAERSASAEEEAPFWPEGVVPVLEWGCGMYAAVDCRSETAAVLLFEPNAVGDDWAAAWFVDDVSLARWLETWVAGTGWYQEDADQEDADQEDADQDEGAGELRPWELAASRIAG